jgi:uracil phosphoribosyltransferase
MPYQEIKHPLLRHKLTIIRNKSCGTKMFREVMEEISALLVYEITRDLSLKTIEVETPMTKTQGFELDQDIVLVPILRAGLGMVNGIQDLIPSAKVAHVGMYRDKDTLLPNVYYSKYPDLISKAKVFVLDPLLATGGSILETIKHLKQLGVDSITVVSVIAVMDGIDKILNAYEDVDIYVAQIDEYLNDHAYILPGLGDAGDRLFGTK